LQFGNKTPDYFGKTAVSMVVSSHLAI